MTTIAFSCQRCKTRFKVPDRLAGKKARCKKCGQNLHVPDAPAAVASAAATGLFRMGAVQANQPPSAPAPQPKSPPRGPSFAPSNPRLAPISSDDLKPVAQERKRQWADDDSIEYTLQKQSADAPTAKPTRQGPLSRRRLFWGQGGIVEVLLVALRKISDYAYLVSIPFLLLILMAIILKRRELAIIAAVVVILLNVVRLGIDGFVLVTLAFKKGPVQGVLFFIPPFTFYYLSKRGQVMKEALGRFLGAALPIIGVALLFIFVPWLRGNEKDEGAAIGGRVRNDLWTVGQNMNAEIRTPQDSKS
jgi:hypothetical protein